MPEALTLDEQSLLLKISRQTLEAAVRRESLPELELNSLSPNLLTYGSVFITLTLDGELRGCIGAIEPYQSLVMDVMEHTIAAAFQDYRFPPVSPNELSKIQIEISRLTPPQRIEYDKPADLLQLVHPGIGLIVKDGLRRATFLPQVWQKIPEPADFLSHLCLKMGSPPDIWLQKPLEVFTYQVEVFKEPLPPVIPG
jgi:AmmeMemoRadiSam system protein A